MDVYVALLNGVVIGAGADLASAQEIAERNRGSLGYRPDWEPWQHTVDSDLWSRRAEGLQLQKIVKVPLAGYVEEVPIEQGPFKQAWDGSNDPIADMRSAEGESLTKLGYNDLAIGDWRRGEAPPVTMDQLVEITAKMKNPPNHPGPIKAGNGPAWDWLRRGLEQMATYPSGQTLPDSVAARMMGIDVILDPDLPPNVVRFGDRIWVINGDAVYETTEQRWPSLYFFGKDSVIDPSAPPNVFRIGNIT